MPPTRNNNNMANIQDLIGLQSSSTNYQPLISANPAAAQQQAASAVTAGNIGQNYLQQGIGSLQQGAAQGTQYRSPYVQGGQGALGQALDYTGISGKPYEEVINQFNQSPAYQFNMQEQLGALDRSAASRGKLYSGQQLKAVQDRASGLASNEWQQGINNTMNLLQQTSPFAEQQAGQQYNLGGDTATMQSQIGDVLGNAELARGNALASGMLGAAGAQVAQSTASGFGKAGLDGGLGSTGGQEVYMGGSTSPWDNTIGSASTTGFDSAAQDLGAGYAGSGGTAGGGTIGTTSKIGETLTSGYAGGGGSTGGGGQFSGGGTGSITGAGGTLSTDSAGNITGSDTTGAGAAAAGAAAGGGGDVGGALGAAADAAGGTGGGATDLSGGFDVSPSDSGGGYVPQDLALGDQLSNDFAGGGDMGGTLSSLIDSVGQEQAGSTARDAYAAAYAKYVSAQKEYYSDPTSEGGAAIRSQGAEMNAMYSALQAAGLW